MGDIIDDVLKAEERAEAMLRDARNREAEMRKAVEEELGAMQAGADKKAQKLMERRLEQAQSEAKATYDEAVNTADEVNRRFLERSKRQFGRIAEKVVQYVVTAEYKRK